MKTLILLNVAALGSIGDCTPDLWRSNRQAGEGSFGTGDSPGLSSGAHPSIESSGAQPIAEGVEIHL